MLYREQSNHHIFQLSETSNKPTNLHHSAEAYVGPRPAAPLSRPCPLRAVGQSFCGAVLASHVFQVLSPLWQGFGDAALCSYWGRSIFGLGKAIQRAPERGIV